MKEDIYLLTTIVLQIVILAILCLFALDAQLYGL